MSGGASPLEYAAWSASTLGRVTERLERAVVLDLAGPAPEFHVLDVGAGDGAYALALAAEGARVTALDRSIPALRAAAARARGAALLPVAGDAAHLPFEDGSFDLVIAVTVLCFVDVPTRVIAELARVLRPGGRLVIGELGRWSAWAAWRRMRGWLGARTWRESHFFTSRELRRAIRDAGLVPGRVRGAVFHPPLATAALLLAPVDPLLGRQTTLGASFIAIEAQKRPAKRAAA